MVYSRQAHNAGRRERLFVQVPVAGSDLTHFDGQVASSGFECNPFFIFIRVNPRNLR
jgi:hypothetical protein